MNANTPKVVVCAGSGGHTAQAKILADMLSDFCAVELLTENQFFVPSVSAISKRGGAQRALAFILLFFFTIPLLALFPIFFWGRTFVFFGPASCFPLMFCAYIYRSPAFFCESWSRFQTHSLTYKVAKLLGFALIVQNADLGDRGNFYFGRLG